MPLGKLVESANPKGPPLGQARHSARQLGCVHVVRGPWSAYLMQKLAPIQNLVLILMQISDPDPKHGEPLDITKISPDVLSAQNGLV